MNKYIIPLAIPPFTELAGDFLSLFFPRYCVSCEDALAKGEQLICTRCILDMPRANHHLNRDNPFYQKLRGRIPVEYVMSLFHFVKSGKVQQVLHALKYKNKPELGVMLGKIYGNDLMDSGYKDAFDLIIPIPLHDTKKKKRGYNQSEEFGNGLSDVMGVTCTDEYLRRLHITSTQTKKSRLKRWENVKEVFQVAQRDKIEGKRILLVDDVVTTGATLEAAGIELLNKGCKAISIACIAATQ